MFAQYLRRKGYDPRILMTNAYVSKAAKEFGFKDSDDLYNQLSYGGNLQTKVANLLQSYEDDRLKLETEEKNKKLIDDLNEISEKTQKRAEHFRTADAETGVMVEGVDNLMISIARCCTPVPGDDIVGYITKGRGISVHRCDCSNIVSLPEEEKARFIDVEWEVLEAGKSYEATITIIGTDRRGMLSDISKACDNLDVNLSGVNAITGKDGSLNMTIQLEISSTQEMDRILRALKSIEGISNVYRARS